MRRLVVVSLALVALVAYAGRPNNSQEMFEYLNGEPSRPAGEDAGTNVTKGLLLQGGSNVASVPVVGGATYVVQCEVDGGAIRLCAASTDGGCTADATDINAGRYVPTGYPGAYVLTHTGTTRIYATADTAVGFTCPVFRMR